MISKKFASSATSAKAVKIAAALVVAGVLAACQDSQGLRSARAYQPIPAETLALIQEKGSSKNAPILIRTYKKESELEIWKQTADGSYTHLKTYPMCRWSGQLGPKKREGDRQVPEGFYSITPAQMNPNSNYYLSFNVGYPNAYDRAQGYTGSMIMVHGDCSSAGCFSMTDEQIAEIYAIAREAFSGGQQAIQMQSMPFRMTPENLAKHRLDPNMSFWKEIKNGYDQFEATKREPRVAVCNGRYAFGSTSANGCAPGEDAQVSALVAEQRRAQDAKVAELVAGGVKPVKVVYSDGGQNPHFAHVSMVSRPEALAAAPVEIALDDKGKPAPRTAVAKAVPTTPAATPQPAAVASQPTPVQPAATAVARSTPQPGPAMPTATAFAPPAPVPTATPAQDKPFYQRIIGIGDLLKSEEAAAATPAPAADTTASTPALKPVVAPQARPSAARSSSRQQPAAQQKPQQNSKIVDPRQKTSSLPGVITGAYQPLPSGVLSFAP